MTRPIISTWTFKSTSYDSAVQSKRKSNSGMQKVDMLSLLPFIHKGGMQRLDDIKPPYEGDRDEWRAWYAFGDFMESHFHKSLANIQQRFGSVNKMPLVKELLDVTKVSFQDFAKKEQHDIQEDHWELWIDAYATGVREACAFAQEALTSPVPISSKEIKLRVENAAAHWVLYIINVKDEGNVWASYSNLDDDQIADSEDEEPATKRLRSF